MSHTASSINRQSGFGLIEILLLIIVVGVLGGTGWYAWHSKNQTDKILAQAQATSQNTTASKTKTTTNVVTYAECLEAKGATVLQDPPVCTYNQQEFVNPPTFINNDYLTINELGVKIPMPNYPGDFSYTYDASSQSATIFSDKVPASCSSLATSSSPGQIGQLQIFASPPPVGSPTSVTINNQTYYFFGPQQGCDPASAKDPHVNDKSFAAVENFKTALQKAVAE